MQFRKPINNPKIKLKAAKYIILDDETNSYMYKKKVYSMDKLKSKINEKYPDIQILLQSNERYINGPQKTNRTLLIIG